VCELVITWITGWRSLIRPTGRSEMRMAVRSQGKVLWPRA